MEVKNFSHEKELRIRSSFVYVVPRVGLEPTRLAAADFESAKTTNSITGAI
jgi:hypothetical protein